MNSVAVDAVHKSTPHMGQISGDSSGPSMGPVCPRQQYRHDITATGTTPHTTTLVNAICAKRLHRHYCGHLALRVEGPLL